jgi:hypothetical protein
MDQPLNVYIGDIKTFWPHSNTNPLPSSQVSLKDKYLQVNPKLSCGIYGSNITAYVFKYYKFSQGEHHLLIDIFKTEGFRDGKVTAEIGRYIMGDYVIDVVFSPKMFDNMPYVDRAKKEYISGTYGFRSGWYWDNDISPLGEIVMNYINELPSTRRDPRSVVRHLAFCMSSRNRKDGLIEGLWQRDGSKPLPDGSVSPSKWRNCNSIFEQYITNGRTPVRYGQCWVFTECLTALLRFLNLPTRSLYVKNAHIDFGADKGIDRGLDSKYRSQTVQYKGDDDDELSVSHPPSDPNKQEGPWDIMVSLFDAHTHHKCDDEDEIILEEYTADVTSPSGIDALNCQYEIPEINDIVNDDDSSWNFHYWNEVWIPSVGWEAVDSSPTEGMLTREDPYKGYNVLGPVPVTSISTGVQTQSWDFDYFYSAVNAVTRNWKYLYIPGRLRPLAYVGSIEYNYPGSVTSEQPVSILTRHPIKSNTFGVVNEELTSDYIPGDKDLALKVHYSDCPILFSSKLSLTGRRLEATVQKCQSCGPYVVQFTFISYINFLISRRWVRDLDKITIPIVPLFSTVSVLIIDISTKRWWAQVL